MFPTTRLSSVVCSVGGGGLIQLEHVVKSITKDWTQPVRRQDKARTIVVIGPGWIDIARTYVLIQYSVHCANIMYVEPPSMYGHPETLDMLIEFSLTYT